MGCATDRVPATRDDFDHVTEPAKMLGKAVHVEGLWRGCRWVLVSFDETYAHIRAKKSGHRMIVEVSRLLKTRRNSTGGQGNG